MPGTMTLRSRCGPCGGAVELGFTPWAGRGPAVAAEWTCPTCETTNMVPAIGEIGWVEPVPGARGGRAPQPSVRTH
jgi:hypothetical protein